MAHRIGIVAIGRNEGERLRRCLTSAIGRAQHVIYVDSGSTDGSGAMARQMGASVVDLDLSIPFTAARARNEGFARLLELDPTCDFVQFVDGDCEIAADWLELAASRLSAREDLAIVCGRRRERFPDKTIYNKLCDIEWNTPVGETKACGGDAMMRVAVVRLVGGFNPSVIAGEEPELCVRVRQKSFKIERLDAEMTLHDADMTRFGQWWKRNVRAGHAYAQGADMHGAPPERHWVREVRSNWVWGLWVPLGAILLAPFTFGLSLVALFALWMIQRSRIANHARVRGMSAADADLYARYVVVGKIPNAMGQLKYCVSKLLGRKSTIIEYKQTSAPAPAPITPPSKATAG